MVAQVFVAAMRSAAAAENPYAWVITRDRDAEISGEKSEVGTAGPGSATDEMLELARTKGVPFRMIDEGDIDECSEGEPGAVSKGHPDYGVVYEGLLYDPSGSWDFGPLDDFGGPNYGCVGIQYKDSDGRWQTL